MVRPVRLISFPAIRAKVRRKLNQRTAKFPFQKEYLLDECGDDVGLQFLGRDAAVDELKDHDRGRGKRRAGAITAERRERIGDETSRLLQNEYQEPKTSAAAPPAVRNRTSANSHAATSTPRSSENFVSLQLKSLVIAA
jgi:hypothetical protein